MGCVWERVWRLKTTLKIKWVFAGSSQEDFLRSEAICTVHDRNVKSHDSWFSYTRETFCFAILTYLLHYVFTHPIYIIITHILRGVFFREKTLAITLESKRLSYPQSSTQSIVVFLNSYYLFLDPLKHNQINLVN